MRRFLFRGTRVVLHTVVGAVLVTAGVVMLLTPGPGIVTIVVGLAVLAREYRWADRLKRRLLGRVRDASTAARARLAERRARPPGHETTEDAPSAATGRPDVHDHDDPPGRMRPAS